MTDNEIIKALECCQSPAAMCKYCSMPKDMQDDCRCMETLSRNALDLINRQKAEIERAQIENRILSQKRINLFERLEIVKKTRAEAVKEFAERLHKNTDEFRDKREMVMLPYTKAALLIIEKKIDNLVKEMVGDSDG